MRTMFARRFGIPVAGFGALLAVLLGSAAVSAAPPQVFTNNGCDVGNYSCLQSAGVNFFGNGYYGRPYYAPYYGVSPYVSPYVAPTYVAPYVVPATTSAPLNASITTGTTSVSPGTVRVGQLITVGVGGFNAGESVTASVTAPNGQVTQIGPAPAAADGTVSVTLTFPAAGSWQMTVHGQTSNKSVGYKFTAQ